MRCYFEVARRSFQRQLAYRTANLAGIAVNGFFMCLRVFIFASVLAQRSSVAAGENFLGSFVQFDDAFWKKQHAFTGRGIDL